MQLTAGYLTIFNQTEFFDMASHFYSNVGNAQVPLRIEKYMGTAFLSATSFSPARVKLTI